MTPEVLPLFDYAQLEPNVRAVAVEAAARIRLEGRRAAQSIVAIGEELSRAKAALGHGHYLGWLEAEFGWSDQQARRFTHVAELVKSNNLLNLEMIDVSALYLISAPRTPDSVREAALERAATGERVTHASVQDHLRDERERIGRAFPSSPPPPPSGDGSGWSWTDVPRSPSEDPPPPKVDPAAQAAFALSAALGGRLEDFNLVEHSPGAVASAVARAVSPALRVRYVAKARRLSSWLEELIKALEMQDAA